MNSAQIRQSFLDFFEKRGHLIVPSSSLMPSSPNLLFTNAGMNQFVPYFLGERSAPCSRIADTQKSIRAGGKHNDLEDVGLDGYHHTFFEMIGNWSFGDYFKRDAIHWAWELLTQVWGFPKERLYATVYSPEAEDPSEFDKEAYDIWTKIFLHEKLDPKIHIRNGNRKDNFWMMGDTGPCGPCSEIHIDLTPEGDTRGELVNKDSPWCIELWNLVFIQFNAQADGTFVPLPAKHVDTGMGFERIAGILATTKNFTQYKQPPSNYNSDLFTDIFCHISSLCGHSYAGTLPSSKNRHEMTQQQQRDCAFRVVADHIRTLSFAIADGILPGNEGRNYVLRRILRRAVLFGKRLDLKSGFFATLVDPLVDKMSSAFPELRAQRDIIYKVISNEERSFDRTLDRGLQHLENLFATHASNKILTGEEAFVLYDTYGFPVDLTEIIAHERGFIIDKARFEIAMEAQRERARQAQQKTIIKLSDPQAAKTATRFVGYDIASLDNYETELVEIIEADTPEGRAYYAILKESPCYAQMGGQLGDTGLIEIDSQPFRILNTLKDETGRWLHRLERAPESTVRPAAAAVVSVERSRRHEIERHHSATHLLHWALRKVLGTHVGQAGSLVAPNYIRFDFTHFEALRPEQMAQIEKLVQQRIVENHPVHWFETPFDQKPEGVIALFGEKYGSVVRVVDMGGFSIELCGGTHVRSTGEIGAFKIIGETAISAGVRRIEAVAGFSAMDYATNQFNELHALAERLSCTTQELPKRLEHLLEERAKLEKALRALQQKQAAGLAHELVQKAHTKGGIAWVVSLVNVASCEDLRGLTAHVAKCLHSQAHVVVLGSQVGDSASVVAICSPEAVAQGIKAGELVKQACSAMDGKGGGKPDFAMGGGKNASKLEEALKTLAAHRTIR